MYEHYFNGISVATVVISLKIETASLCILLLGSPATLYICFYLTKIFLKSIAEKFLLSWQLAVHKFFR